MDKKSPRCQLLQMEASSWLMRSLDSVRGIEGVKSVSAAAAYELGMEAVLSKESRAFISAYCVFMVAANRSRAAPLLAEAAVRLSK